MPGLLERAGAPGRAGAAAVSARQYFRTAVARRAALDAAPPPAMRVDRRKLRGLQQQHTARHAPQREERRCANPACGRTFWVASPRSRKQFCTGQACSGWFRHRERQRQQASAAPVTRPTPFVTHVPGSTLFGARIIR